MQRVSGDTSTWEANERVPASVIYYVRHGLTDWNVQQRLQGRDDVPLNTQGCAQAVCCAKILQDLFRRDDRAPESFDYVSSPLVRARKTMEIMRATLGLEPAGYTVEARLAEIAFGKWEGLTYSEVMARDKHIVAERESDRWGFTPPGGESYRALTRRVAAWYETLAGDTVVTAHGGVARGLIAYFRIMSEEEATHTDITHDVVYVFADGALTRYS